MVGGCCGTTPEHVRWMAKSGRMLGDQRTDVGRARAVKTVQPAIVLAPTPLAERSAFAAKIRRGERIERYQAIRIHKEGHRLNISLTISPVRDASGRIVGAAKIAHDITENKRAQKALEDEARALETLNRLGQTVAAQLDLDEVVQMVTDAATELSGAAFGAFFYNVVDQDKESYWLYTLSGAPREAFARFPMPRATAVFAALSLMTQIRLINGKMPPGWKRAISTMMAP